MALANSATAKQSSLEGRTCPRSLRPKLRTTKGGRGLGAGVGSAGVATEGGSVRGASGFRRDRLSRATGHPCRFTRQEAKARDKPPAGENDNPPSGPGSPPAVTPHPVLPWHTASSTGRTLETGRSKKTARGPAETLRGRVLLTRNPPLRRSVFPCQ